LHGDVAGQDVLTTPVAKKKESDAELKTSFGEVTFPLPTGTGQGQPDIKHQQHLSATESERAELKAVDTAQRSFDMIDNFHFTCFKNFTNAFKLFVFTED